MCAVRWWSKSSSRKKECSRWGGWDTLFSLSLLRVLWCELSNLIFTIESVYNFWWATKPLRSSAACRRKRWGGRRTQTHIHSRCSSSSKWLWRTSREKTEGKIENVELLRVENYCVWKKQFKLLAAVLSRLTSIHRSLWTVNTLQPEREGGKRSSVMWNIVTRASRKYMCVKNPQ